MPLSLRLAFRHWPRGFSTTVRTAVYEIRTYGGVGGAEERSFPLSRSRVRALRRAVSIGLSWEVSYAIRARFVVLCHLRPSGGCAFGALGGADRRGFRQGHRKSAGDL